MNYLEVSWKLANHTDPGHEGNYESHIQTTQLIMQVLTFALLLTFGGVGIKKAFVKARSRATSLNLGRRSVGQKRRGASKRSGEFLESRSTRDKHSRDKHSLSIELQSYKSSSSVNKSGINKGLATRPTSLSTDSQPEVAALPSPSAPNSVLPPGWTEHFTSDGKAYYSNQTTGETVWTLPSSSI